MISLEQQAILARQKPLETGFGAETTAGEVLQDISLEGKTAIVTGGYSGLGLETVRTLRQAGAKVVVPVRDLERAKLALAGIDVEIEPMDLLDPFSISRFAEGYLSSGRPLHILVNSAGIMVRPLTRDLRGYESQFATNHLGHFQLTTRLLPALRLANDARVVNVSASGHHFSPVEFDDPNFEHRAYDPLLAYGQSKTANILFTLALDERFKSAGIRAFSVHPGVIVDTGLAKHLPIEMFRAQGVIDENGRPILDPARNLKSTEQGAATQVWCATSPMLNGRGGLYCENCDIAPLDSSETTLVRTEGKSRHDGVAPYAIDLNAAERLWSLSEQLLEGTHR